MLSQCLTAFSDLGRYHALLSQWQDSYGDTRNYRPLLFMCLFEAGQLLERDC
jgi:hypothetical protein